MMWRHAKRIILIGLLLIGSYLVIPAQTTKATKTSLLRQRYGYVIKGQGQKRVYFLSRFGKQGFLLTPTDTTDNLAIIAGKRKTSSKKSVAPIIHATGWKTAKRHLRRVKLIRSQTTLPRVKYWVASKKNNFYSFPTGVVRHRTTIYHERDFSAQTLYATSRLTNRNGQRFLKMETQTGQKLGWINAKALHRGSYQSPLDYYEASGHAMKNSWTAPDSPNIRLGLVTSNGVVPQIFVQKSATSGLILNVTEKGLRSCQTMGQDHVLSGIKSKDQIPLGQGQMFNSFLYNLTHKFFRIEIKSANPEHEGMGYVVNISVPDAEMQVSNLQRLLEYE